MKKITLILALISLAFGSKAQYPSLDFGGTIFSFPTTVGTRYDTVITKNNGWSLTGNAVYDTSKNFIGTTGTATGVEKLYFKLRNQPAGFLSGSSQRNTGFGTNAQLYNTNAFGSANWSGTDNSDFGYGAGQNNKSGYANTRMGVFSGKNMTANFYNTAIGYYSQASNANGSWTTSVGTSAGDGGYTNLVGCVFIGRNANVMNLPLDTTVTYATAIGTNANVWKSNQTVIGNTNVTETIIRGDVFAKVVAVSKQLTQIDTLKFNTLDSTNFFIADNISNAYVNPPLYSRALLNGQEFKLRISTSSGANKNLTWNSIYRFGTTYPTVSTATSSSTYYFTFVYNATAAKFDVTNVTVF